MCSLKKYAVKGVRAFCLELVLHSFQMAFLSFNYVKSHIDRNLLAHVIESHSSLAIPEMCVYTLKYMVAQRGQILERLEFSIRGKDNGGGRIPYITLDVSPRASFF